MSLEFGGIAHVVCIAGLLAVNVLATGCESCSFTFGGVPLHVRVYAPLGYEDYELRIDDGVSRHDDAVLGVFDTEGAMGATSDGPRKCVFPEITVVAEHPACERAVVTIPESRATKDAEDAFANIALLCPPADVPGQVGWWCIDDADCGNDGFLCELSSHTCVPPSCASSVECNPPQAPESESGEVHFPLVCEPDSRRCAPSGCETCIDEGLCMGASVPGWVGQARTCYRACALNVADACPGDFECVSPESLFPESAAAAARCQPTGASGPGEACAATEVSTGCIQGHICQAGTCRRQCDLYGSGATACDPGERCAFDLIPGDGADYHASPTCTSDAVDPAQVGETCTTDQWRCADDGARALGVCAQGGICQAMCFGPSADDPACGTCSLWGPLRSGDEESDWIPAIPLCTP